MEKICLSVQEGYERWAATYDRDPNPVLALEERQLRLMLPSVQGKRVLDLACGTGRWLEWLMAQGAGAGAGVDFSPAMLAAAQRKPTLRGRLVQADCGAIPFANAAFDVVVCSFAVGHIADLRQVAREVARVATTRGRRLCDRPSPLRLSAGLANGIPRSARPGGNRDVAPIDTGVSRPLDFCRI